MSANLLSGQEILLGCNLNIRDKSMLGGAVKALQKKYRGLLRIAYRSGGLGLIGFVFS